MSAAAANAPMPERVEKRLREAAYEHAGIVLGPEKASLVTARVQKRLRALGMTDYTDYLAHFESHPEEVQEFINVITTNTTSFWREPDHFTLLLELMDQWLATGQSRFRLWCAASSTGQEPYTLALTLAKLVEERHLDLQILATDIDTQVLAKAKRAVYAADALEGVPAEHRSTGFQKVDGGFRVVDRVRRLVRFAQLNLTRPPYPMKGPLDLVICRNVMIYLDAEARAAFTRECERLLKADGVLLIGHSESVVGSTRKLRIVRPSVYRMNTQRTP
ncbi:MAG: CheR family methyltransferase [Myxococcota bacterium]